MKFRKLAASIGLAMAFLATATFASPMAGAHKVSAANLEESSSDDSAGGNEVSSDSLTPDSEDNDDGALPGLGAGVTSQITVTGGTEGTDYTKAEDGTLTVKTATPLVIDGGGKPITTEQIILGVSDESASDINVTFKNLIITKTSSTAPVLIVDNFKKNVNLTLVGKNELHAGPKRAAIEKNSLAEDGTLTIKGNGSLTAEGGEYAAGIGSG
ncbi:MAG: hypothetical protein K5989_00350, partial [Lachnospiraceae bacterium]|nr:hypothetical protein [Lachnospiraceae bacterium]